MITCIYENASKTSLRHITVDSIVLNKKSEVLLVKRASNLQRGGKYTLPGGFLDRNENLEKGVLRELKEETGLIGKVKFLFQINDNPKRPKENRQNVTFVFIVELKGGKESLNSEVCDIKWFSKETLPNDVDFAFDHRATILKYYLYLKRSFSLPIIGKI